MSESYAYYEDINWALLRLFGDVSGQRVLDVGAGFATTSAEIEKRGNSVTTIEISSEAVEKARSRVSRVVQADLCDVERVGRELGDETFDVLIFADVLEHLPNPLDVLQSYIRFLKPEGRLLVSLPNVGLWAVRLMLLFGRFEYADTGVLDRTHLRFFTRRSARRLVEAAGMKVVRTTHNPGLVRPFVPVLKQLAGSRGSESHDPGALLDSPAYQAYMKFVHPVERGITAVAPGLLAFQVVMEAKRA